MTLKTYQLETLSCPGCSANIEGMLKRVRGVREYEVLFNSSRVKVSFDEGEVSSDEIKEKITKLGFKVLGEK